MAALDSMGFDPPPAPEPPIEQDRATRARNTEGNVFAQHVTGREETDEDRGILAHARDVASASLFHALIGSAGVNTEAHPPTTVQEAVGIDPRVAAMEMRNARVMTSVQGYVGRPMLSVQDRFGVIRSIMPEADLRDARINAGIDGYEAGGTRAGRRSEVRRVIRGREPAWYHGEHEHDPCDG